MAAGIARQTFECPESTYPYNDVRGRQTVLRAFVDYLVSLNIGWTIDSETVPTANFTSAATQYIIWIKYKNSDHKFRFYVYGGTTYILGMECYKAGSTSVMLNTYNVQLGAIGYSHKLMLSGLYGANWCVFVLLGYNSATYQDPASGAFCGFSARTLEDFTNPVNTTELILANFNTSQSMFERMYSGYLTGSDISLTVPNFQLTASSAATVERMMKLPISETNWQFIDNFVYSNKAMVAQGSIITINGSNYWVWTSANNASRIAKLGA